MEIMKKGTFIGLSNLKVDTTRSDNLQEIDRALDTYHELAEDGAEQTAIKDALKGLLPNPDHRESHLLVSPRSERA